MNYEVWGNGKPYDDNSPNEIIVNGLSASKLVDFVDQEFNRSIYYRAVNVAHSAYFCITFDMVFENNYNVSDPVSFIQEALSRVTQRVQELGFNITIQYAYKNVSTSIDTGSIVVGESPLNDSIKHVDDCQTFNACFKQNILNLLKLMDKTKSDVSNVTTTYDKYLDCVENSDVEYSTTLGVYDGEYAITQPIKGDKFNVSNDLNKSSIFEVHNHPNQTIPSFKDVLFAARNANDPQLPNFKGLFVYDSPNRIYYGLYVQDPLRAEYFYKRYSSELDPTTNSFKDKGIIDNILGLLKIGDADSLAQLVSILKFFDTGIILSKITLDDITVYDTDLKNGNKKDGYVKITICTDAR